VVEGKIVLGREKDVCRGTSVSNKGCSTHHSPLESGRGAFALLPAAAEAKVGAMAKGKATVEGRWCCRSQIFWVDEGGSGNCGGAGATGTMEQRQLDWWWAEE
jgi:hypothetical protein